MVHKRLVRNLQERLTARPDQELLDIWIANDRLQWSAEYFQAIQLVLTERGVALPPQLTPGQAPQPATLPHPLDYATPTPTPLATRVREWVWFFAVAWLLLGAVGLFLDGLANRRLQKPPTPPAASRPALPQRGAVD